MKIKIVILLCAIAVNAAAQTDKETKTVFGNGKLHLGYFLSPSCHVGNIAGSTAVLPGLGAGIIFNEKISLGLTYKFIISENTPAGETNDMLYLDQQYAGIKGEYSFIPDKVVHPNIQHEAGVGHTELDLKDAYETGDVPQGDASFAYFEPGAALEINLWKYLKLDVGVGYRFIGDVAVNNLSGTDFAGISYSAALKIGLF